ncbi:hypothetical protein ABGB18_01080 [Nonomuraea sp. B12E4]|uniref:hypothetical protein n=1 Tax=Nonomuraea sp. B12E4 TaxID=3153564 RepID=UPI00325EC246
MTTFGHFRADAARAFREAGGGDKPVLGGLRACYACAEHHVSALGRSAPRTPQTPV